MRPIEHALLMPIARLESRKNSGMVSQQQRQTDRPQHVDAPIWRKMPAGASPSREIVGSSR